MAGRAGGTLRDDAPQLETVGGDGWIAVVNTVWRPDLERGGWLQRDPALHEREGNPARLRQTPQPPTRATRSQTTGRGTIFRSALGAGTMIVRPLHRGGWLAPVLGQRLLRRERPLDEIRVTAALRTRGAPVPDPVMALAWRGRDRFWRGLVATREIEGARNGHEFLATRPSRVDRNRALLAAGSALRTFHDAGGRHPDLNLGNLLVEAASAGSDPKRVWIIDLDGARARSSPSPRRRMRELMRLFRSLRKSGRRDAAESPPTRMAAWLFHAYCDGDRRLRAQLLRWRRLEEARVALHALGYRPH